MKKHNIKNNKTMFIISLIAGISLILFAGIIIGNIFLNNSNSYFARIRVAIKKKVQIVYNYNLFDANNDSLKEYNKDTKTLVIDGNLNSNNIVLGSLDNISFKKGDRYRVTINYISGSYTNNPQFVFELQKDNEYYTDRKNGTHYIADTLPTKGITYDRVITIKEDTKDANGFNYRIYQDNEVTFNNYKIQILITKLESKIGVAGEKYGKLPTPEKDGYEFLGWYDSISGGKKITETNTILKKYNHPIYAHWDETIYPYNSNSTILADALDKTLNENVNFNKSGNLLLFGSDYQGESRRKKNFNGILENISNNNISPNLIMLLGDYSESNEQSNSKKGIEEANSIIRSYKNFNNSGTLYLQGNHDSKNYNPYLIKTGAYETDNYIIYAINYSDFHCSNHNTCNELDNYLSSVANSKSKKPIFVVTHLPLHATSRADNKDAYLTIDTLNKYGDKLDIIVMFAHNHSASYDKCNGGTTTYFAKGSTMEYYKNSKILTDTIKFTYLNAGYIASVSSGYVNGTVKCNGVLKESSNELTMTLFTINKSSIVVDRYSKDAKLSSNIIKR